MTSTSASPHDLEAERAVLGAVLVHNEAFALAAGVVGPRDFFRDAHRRVFGAMALLRGRGEPVDFVTLKTELQRAGDLDEVGGPAYVAALADGVPRSVNVDYYARIVKEHAMRRELQRLASGAIADAADLETDLEVVVDRVRRAVLALQDIELRGRRVPDHVAHVSQVMADVKAALQAGPPEFVSTPWPALNVMLGGGFAPGELVFLGARPGIGKTVMAVEIARRTGKRGASVLMVSREMLTVAIGMRMIAQEGPVSATSLRKRDLSPQHWSTIDLAIETLESLPIFITHARLTIDAIRRLVGVLAEEAPLGLLIVDYLQLVDADPSIRDRRLQVEAVSAGLKGITLDYETPVLCLSSLSRPVDGKAPTLASLRESGNLEHDADTVILLHRPEEMRPETDCIVAKSRNGRTGKVELSFRGEYLRFEEQAGPKYA